MAIALGVDTLTCHCRLDAGEVTVEDVLAESAALGFAHVQLNIVHLRDRTPQQLAGLRRTADDGSGVKLILENHSDFTADEYAQVIEAVGADRVSVFLDIINPISSLEDPVPVIRRLLPWAPSGHVKDYRFESMYVEGGYHRRGFQVHWCYPGEGEGLDSRRRVADQSGRLRAALAVLRELLPASATVGAGG